MSTRPDSAPDFLLSRAHGSVRTQGSRAQYNTIDAALQALRTGDTEMIVGALPFERALPCALTAPEKIIREDGPLEPHSYYRIGEGSALTATLLGTTPSLDEHETIVAAAIRTIEATQLEKVVLARSIDIGFEPAVDPRLIAARLIDLSTNKDGFIADLSPAGEDYKGHWLVGASPETLIRKQGSTVTAYPLAGSAPRNSHPETDRARAHALAADPKERAEHAFVVEHLRRLLAPICERLDIPNAPELTATREMWHLATPIVGTLKEEITALELAELVHPTPAICGTPTDAAEALIKEAERPRGFYAGAVGWCDNSGDGEFMVAIRCAEVYDEGRRATAWAGGGIVIDADPAQEVIETNAKLQTILRALGIPNAETTLY